MMALSLSADFLLFDNIETVSYARRDLTGNTLANYAGVYALKRASQTQTSHMGPAEAVIESARWHLQSAALAVKPRRGDRFTSATYGVWEVLDAEACAFSTRWACNCQKVS